MRRLASLAALAFLVPVSAEAQVPRIQFGVGATAPIGDMADGNDVGFHLRGSIGLSFPLFPVTIRADGELHRLGEAFTDDNSNLLAGTINGMVDIVALGMLGTGGQLYLVAGGGYYSFDPSIADAVADAGIQGGLGATIGALGFGGMIEAKVVNVFATNSYRYIPITVGLKF